MRLPGDPDFHQRIAHRVVDFLHRDFKASRLHAVDLFLTQLPVGLSGVTGQVHDLHHRRLLTGQWSHGAKGFLPVIDRQPRPVSKRDRNVLKLPALLHFHALSAAGLPVASTDHLELPFLSTEVCGDRLSYPKADTLRLADGLGGFLREAFGWAGNGDEHGGQHGQRGQSQDRSMMTHAPMFRIGEGLRLIVGAASDGPLTSEGRGDCVVSVDSARDAISRSRPVATCSDEARASRICSGTACQCST